MGVLNGLEISAGGGALKTRTGLRVAVVGDSLTANGLNSGRGMGGVRAWWQWGQLYSGRRFYIANVAAVGGYKTDDVIANSIPFIINRVAWPNSNGGGTTATPKVDVCVEFVGTNDLFVSPTKTTAQLLAQKKIIWDMLRAAGIEPVTATLTPRNNATETNTIMRFNAALAAFAAAENVRVVDFYAYTADPTNGQWKSGYNITGDPIHAEGPGAQAMGRAFAAAMSGFPATLPQLMAQNDNIMWRNSLFYGDDGSGFPNGPGWGKNGIPTNGTTSINSGDANVVGNRFDITALNSTNPFVRTPGFAGAAEGRYVAISARFKAILAGTSPLWRVDLVQSISSGSPLVGMTATLSTDDWVDFYSVVQLPVGYGAPALEMGIAGAGSVLSIGQIGIWDVTDAIS